MVGGGGGSESLTSCFSVRDFESRWEIREGGFGSLDRTVCVACCDPEVLDAKDACRRTIRRNCIPRDVGGMMYKKYCDYLVLATP